MTKIVQFQRVDEALYYLTDDGKLWRFLPWRHPKPEAFDPKTGKWK